ncbi:unnamed protein product [Arabis nemorensis]|uniref:Uncharacterized protein n=1 Tax=Arabis nemorensis TaxID=586526 RepID=A0A565CBA9_9BRAS|nr:unnamed protein product [Arabis nemorensis]
MGQGEARETVFFQLFIFNFHRCDLPRRKLDVSGHVKWLKTVYLHTSSYLISISTSNMANLSCDGIYSLVRPVMKGNPMKLYPEGDGRRERVRDDGFPSLQDEHPFPEMIWSF